MRSTATEIETKLAVDGGFSLPDLAGIGLVAAVSAPRELDLYATYLDTAGLRLARYGVTLRHRTGEGAARWTLKLPAVFGGSGADATTESATARLELDWPGKPGAVPVEAVELLTALTRGAEVSPVRTLRTRRTLRVLHGAGGEELAELADDDVSVIDGERTVARFRELEVEAREAPMEQMAEVIAGLRAAGAVTAEPLPKFVRALGAEATGPADIAVPQLADGDARSFVRAALAEDAQRLIRNDPATRLDDTEALHQMRVASRRLRSDLRTFASYAPPHADELSDELRWLAGTLGAVRDLDVQIKRLLAGAGDLGATLAPFFEALTARRDAARNELLSAMRGERYLHLLDMLVRLVQDESASATPSASAVDALPTIAADSWRKLRRAAGSLSDGAPDTAFHAVRIRAKRARYAAEAVRPALDGEAATAAQGYARHVAELQDVLGEMQDAVVSVEHLADAVASRPSDGPFNLAAGRLMERQIETHRAARTAVPRVWRALDRKRHRRWMES